MERSMQIDYSGPDWLEVMWLAVVEPYYMASPFAGWRVPICLDKVTHTNA